MLVLVLMLVEMEAAVVSGMLAAEPVMMDEVVDEMAVDGMAVVGSPQMSSMMTMRQVARREGAKGKT